MKSKWFGLKDKATKFRLNGNSIREIEKRLSIPKSTLSGWFKDLKLPKSKEVILYNRWKKSLIKARKKAIVWHNQEKQNRIKIAEKEAEKTFNKIDLDNKTYFELSLAMLYLGEGAKSGKTAIGNSDPTILKFFIKGMEKIFNLERGKINCDLHLRADQNPQEIKKYWSSQLNIPIDNFKYFSVDKRTLGKKTHPYYKGVCVLNYGNIAIQRKLVYLSKKYCNEIYNK